VEGPGRALILGIETSCDETAAALVTAEGRKVPQTDAERAQALRPRDDGCVRLRPYKERRNIRDERNRLGRRPLQKHRMREKRYLAVMAEAPTTIYSYFLPLTLNFILSLSSVN